MPARTPLEVDELFGKAMETHDIEALVALYEPMAVVPGPAGTAVGLDQIRAALMPFIALKASGVNLDARVVAEVGDIAIVYNDWSGTGHAPDGTTIPLAGKAIEVARRQADGSWKMIFDDPNARG